MGICSKEEKRKFYKNILTEAKKNFSVWSSKIWTNLAIQNYGNKVIGSYIPLAGEPIVPVNPDFVYPQIINSKQMKYEKKPDLILIPGLCFSEDGYRLGRGKGYFDQYIAEHPEVIRIALAFDVQVVSKADWTVDPWDQKVHEIVTQTRRIKNGN